MDSIDGVPGFNDIENVVASGAVAARGILGLEDLVDAELGVGEVRKTIAIQTNSNSVHENEKPMKDFIDSTNSVARTKTTNF